MNWKHYLLWIGIIIVLFIALIGSMALKARYGTSPTNQNQNQNPNSNQNTNTSEKQNIDDVHNGLTMSYPRSLTLTPEEINEINLPYGNKTAPGDIGYYHSINVEYCAPSGVCSSTTQDFEFRETVLNMPLTQIKAKLTDTKTEAIGNYTVTTSTAGVEGEGQNYYFIPISAQKTLYFVQSYKDESILAKYQKEPDFIKLADQNKLMREIIASVKIY